jgi:hypothetical protein
MVIWCYPRSNRFWTMYMTLMSLWWLFFVNREATLWSVSSMRSSRMIKCFSLGSRVSKSAIIGRIRLHLRFRIGLVFSITPSNSIRRRYPHVMNVVDESSDKDGFSTSGWSRYHAGKRVGPRHAVIRKSSAGYFKHEWVARRVYKVQFLGFGLVL